MSPGGTDWWPDVTAPLDLALQAFGLDRLPVDQPPRLLSDTGPSYVAAELADWLNEQGTSHTRGDLRMTLAPG
jgi:putative transposase